MTIVSQKPEFTYPLGNNTNMDSLGHIAGQSSFTFMNE